MAVVSGYYNSKGGDRRYNAETMSKYFQGLFSRGVSEIYGDKLAVNQKGGFKLVVEAGKCFFSDGRWCENTAKLELSCEEPHVILDRIDRVIVRNDTSDPVRGCSIFVRSGTPSNSPVPPALVATDHIEEMSLAQINVSKGAVGITQSDITDERPDNDCCGFVYALGQKVSVDDLYRQHQAIFDEFMTGSHGTMTAIERAERGRAEAESERQSAEEVRVAESERSVSAADDAAARAQSAADNVDAEVSKAVTAASNAERVAESVRHDADSGRFNGRDGAPGIVTQLNPGMFGLAIDLDGHLIMTHNDNDPTPPLSLTDDGRLIYTIE